MCQEKTGSLDQELLRPGSLNSWIDMGLSRVEFRKSGFVFHYSFIYFLDTLRS